VFSVTSVAKRIGFMKRIVLGTAGHIDHGKTTLIKALTGVDCDRLKEEKERGITIELGFTSMVLPSGSTISIVDVPGHEKFVRHMVAGATGIDLVALVIAADEGIMPQTREHLDICKLLRVKKGLVALTKIDLVEQDWLEMVKEKLRISHKDLDFKEIVDYLHSRGVTVYSAALDQPTLEDVFIQITGKKLRD